MPEKNDATVSISIFPHLPQWLERSDTVLKQWLLPFGLLVQLTGLLWMGSSGGYVSQTYLWCLLPGYLSLGIDLYRHGWRACVQGMTFGEKALALLFFWMLIHPTFAPGGMDISTVINRIVKIVAYLYVVHTVLRHSRHAKRLILIATAIAVSFAAVTIIYQLGVLDLDAGVRVLGEEKFRLSSVGIGKLAIDLRHPILASLYYGVFAAILSGYLASTAFDMKKYFLASLGLVTVVVFTLFSARGPLLAVLAAIGFALIITQQPWKKWVIAAGIGGAAVLFLSFNQIILEQIDLVLADGFNGRFTHWQIAWESIVKSPLIGQGANAEFKSHWLGMDIQHPHSMYVSLAYFWGIPALLIFLVIAGWSLVQSVRYSHLPLVAMAGCVMMFGLVGMFTDTYNFLIRPDLTWLLFFFPVAMFSAIERKEQTEPQESALPAA